MSFFYIKNSDLGSMFESHLVIDVWKGGKNWDLMLWLVDLCFMWKGEIKWDLVGEDR